MGNSNLQPKDDARAAAPDRLAQHQIRAMQHVYREAEKLRRYAGQHELPFTAYMFEMIMRDTAERLERALQQAD